MYAKKGTGKIKRICETCGKEFIAWAYEIRNGNARFCSWKCRSKSTGFQEKNKIRLGAKQTEKWKDIMSKIISEKMKENSWGFKKGEPSVFKGKKRPNMTGEKHWNWRGGIAPINQKIRGSLEYKIWEDSVKNIDNYICQKCGELRISKLTVHHIKNFAQFSELRFALDNGITLCRDCHKKFHKRYGKKNNNQEQIKEFLTTK